ncbi:MAG: YeeE/YedE family protein [Nitrosomonas sp.]|nr:MAG: YeeE/YedE family protein [Nitrosomonas sp.]
MISILIALISGLVFGIGLILSEMANPEKVLSFLDMTGSWDPSLAFVMLGAISIGAIAFTLARRRGQTYLGSTINLPTSRVIDKRLILGSLAFGIGWGIAGICPGPGLVLVGTGNLHGVVFVLAMLAGMGIFEMLERYRARQSKTDK